MRAHNLGSMECGKKRAHNLGAWNVERKELVTCTDMISSRPIYPRKLQI
jgi:hypothetical protein